MKRIEDIQELREIQMGIMDYIHNYCFAHNIKYTLAGGTLIGALRHKGYVPWDDDIDIYMMRNDYNRFLREYRNEDERFQLLTPHNTTTYMYTFSKMVDTRTVMHEDEVRGYEIGVYVDIFPLDYVPNNLKIRRCVFWLKHMLYKIRRCKMLKTQYLDSQIAYYCYRNLPISISGIDWLLDVFVHRKRPSHFICEMCDTERPFRSCFSVESFHNTIDVPFENRTYRAMIGYDEYLTNTYGNYMTLPPKGLQIHHHFKAYWK